MKKALSLISLFLFAGAIFIGCKPKASNEGQYWENNKKEFAEAVAKYPAFKDLLNKKMAEAQKIWDDAAKISNEDEKGKKMKEANEKLNELLNQFTQIKYKSKGIEDAIVKFNEKKLTKEEDKIRVKAVAEARKALKEIDASLAKAKPKTDDDAKKVTKEAIDKLISSQGDIDRAIKSVEPKKEKKEEKKKK